MYPLSVTTHRRIQGGFMIGCDKCGEWYHGRCLALSKKETQDQASCTCNREFAVGLMNAKGLTRRRPAQPQPQLRPNPNPAPNPARPHLVAQ